jgi:hypothetical protein
MKLRLSHPHMMLTLAVAAAILAGCGKPAGKAPAPTGSTAIRTEELASGRIGLMLAAEPATVRLDRPLFITLSLTAPDGVAVEWPALDDRFEGFDLSGSYEAGVRAEGGRTTRDWRLRLTPKAAAEYRLKPMAVTYRETNNPAAAPGWIRTRPVVFAVEALPAASGMAPIAGPLTILPTAREIGLVLLLLLLAAAAVAGLVCLARKLLRARRLRQMSPRQRALLELEELASKHLVEAGLIKAFYFELTLVVRRYIERGHGIRAPEQTTEEFLVSAGADPRFPRESLQRLQTFLTAADYVKFANFQPGPDAGPRALDTARDYVSTDPAAPEQAGGR